MDHLQFRAAVIGLYGQRTMADYGRLFGITGGAFNMFWRGAKKISKPMEQRLRLAYEHKLETSKRPVFLIHHDEWARHQHQVLWPANGLGRQLWILFCLERFMSKVEYLQSFDRIALTYLPKTIKSKAYNQTRRQMAWDRAPTIWEGLKGHRVMIMDEEVANVIGYPVINPEPYGRWREYKGVTFCRMPRRSGVGLYAEEHFPLVRNVMREVYLDWLSQVQ